MAINNGQKENLFLSGGTLYLEPYKNGALTGEKFDMGATEITVSRDTTTAQAFTKAGGLKQKIAEVVTEENYTMRIKCNSFSPANLAAALGSEVKEVTIKNGETLPNGATATADASFVKLEAGINPLLTARITFDGTPVQGKKAVVVFHEASIKFSGELPLMSEEFATADFEASAVKTDKGYMDYYIATSEVSGSGGGTSGGGQSGGGGSQVIDPQPETPQDKYIVLAVAGQSNSVGYDESDWDESTHGNTAPDRLKVLGMKGANNMQIIALSPTTENMQDMSTFGRQTKGTKGIHLPLATELLPHIPSDYKLLIVPVAYGWTGFTGGTALEYDSTNKKPTKADPANGLWDSTSAYYQTLRDRVIYALDLNPENKFAGVVWCQGEYDKAKPDEHLTGFQTMVEKLSADWAAYANRTNSKKMDKSLWVTHETTHAWRVRQSAGAQGNDGSWVWSNYSTYLGLNNYVPIAPINDYTNAVAGCADGNVGKTTSSSPATHYGNDAFKKVVAPRVADRLLRNNAIYGQAANARILTGLEARVEHILGTRKRGYTFAENGDITCHNVSATNHNFNTYAFGIPSIVFEDSVRNIELTNIAGSQGIMILLEYNDRGNFSAVYLQDNTPNFKFASSYGTTKTLESQQAGWDELATGPITNTAATITGTTKIGISHNGAGVYTFTKDGAAWFNFNLATCAKNLKTRITDGYSSGAYRLGIVYGWGTSCTFGSPLVNVTIK